MQRDFDRVFSLPNLLRPSEQFDLGDMDESVQLENKFGPPQVDFIVCPTAPTPPPSLDSISKQTPIDSYMNDVFTVPASLAGLPAISIPFVIPEEYRQRDTPAFAGIQLIGQYSDDLRLLKIAVMLERLHQEQRKRLKAVQLLGIRKYFSRPRIRKVSQDVPISKAHWETSVRKHESGKGENSLREPRTPEEVNKAIEDVLADWDSLVFGDNWWDTKW